MTYFFIVASIFLSSFFIGPFSIRVYSGFLMIVYLVVSKKNETIKGVEYLTLYSVFILSVLISEFVIGEFEPQVALKRFFAYDLISFITFISLMRYLHDYQDVTRLIFVLSICNIVNSIISIGQVQYAGWAWSISNIICVSSYSNDLITGFAKSYSTDSLFASSFISGILGDTVKNGYVTASLTLLSICLFMSTSKQIKYIGVCSFVLGLVSSFVIQQRAAFYMLMISCFIIGVSKIKRMWVLWILGCFIFILFVLNYRLENTDFLGRLGDRSNRIRENLNTFSLNYIWENLIFGGMNEYVRITRYHPHNYLFSGFISGGIIGGIVAIVFYVKMSADVIKTFIRNFFKQNYSVICCCILLLNMVVSFSHNTSIVARDSFIWVFLALLIKTEILNKKDNL